MFQTKAVGAVTSTTLDLVRFLCSQGVLAGHLFYFLNIGAGSLTGLASYCVLIFFVLSGFLISLSLFRNLSSDQSYNFGSYFRDRFFRIYPPFLASLVFVFALDAIGFLIASQPFSLTAYLFEFIVNILQLQEFPAATYLNEQFMIEFFRFNCFGTNLPLWTIGIEWWMYMFFGLGVFLWTGKIKFRIMYVPILFILMISPVYFIFRATHMAPGLTLYWFMGTLITLISGKVSIKKGVTPVAAGILLILAGLTSFHQLGFTPSIIIFCVGLLTLQAVEQGCHFTVNKSIRRTAKFLAGYSYSLYLIHYPILYFAVYVFKPSGEISTFILLYLIVNIIAIIFARLFEFPSNKWKQAYENYRSRSH
jgi:peptidoglycan/LPS O-acetylase OafA/YrhL